VQAFGKRCKPARFDTTREKSRCIAIANKMNKCFDKQIIRGESASKQYTRSTHI